MPQESQLPPGATSRDLKPTGVLARAKAKVGRWLLEGVDTTWFGPQQPIAPQAPVDVKGRAFDYQSGYNIVYTPRSTEPIGFEQLRFLADSCDILRLVIETRKDQMGSLGWNIKSKDKQQQQKGEQNPNKPDPNQKKIDVITEFFKKPDGVLTWKQWLRAILEDLFVVDAVSIYKRKTVGGAPFAYELMDGTTIFPLMEDDGRRPHAPDPAFQQITKGVPAADFSIDELLYLPRNVRTNRLYGFPPVQQVILTVNTAILRAVHQLDYYTEGSIPDSIIGTPLDWQPEQITAFQLQWDEMLAGNLEARRRAKFVPGDFKFQELKQPALKDEYDEWLARVICFAFSIPPTAFIKSVNRASAESSHDQALEEGLLPIQLWVKEFMDEIIAQDFNCPNLEFVWEDDREVDPETQCTILVDYVNAGIKTRNEVRSVLGDDPIPGEADELMVTTGTGATPLSAYDDTQEMQQDQQDNQHKVALTAAKNPAPVAAPVGTPGGATPSKTKANKEKKSVKQQAAKMYMDELRKAGDGRTPIPFQPDTDKTGNQRIQARRFSYLAQGTARARNANTR